ncbi:MAG TPA: M13 family metallopeptidase [Verrucomicrobiae bacterium]|jgi:putative endopeptidase|nr:M13 family metallopeptidase [Verrucomicrobiae bacterium]
MKRSYPLLGFALATGAILLTNYLSFAAEPPPKIPRFSIQYMDQSVDPGADFFHYAAGTWLKDNPVPADKSRWASFDQLHLRNMHLLRDIMEKAAADTTAAPHTPIREVGDFYASAMDTNRINELGAKPLEADFARIDALKSTEELMQFLAELQSRGVGAMFDAGAEADEKNSEIYALHLSQGGLALPDRDYYLTDAFKTQRNAYLVHIATMLNLAGQDVNSSMRHALGILALETELARASKSRTDRRDPVANYHKFTVAEMMTNYPDLHLDKFIAALGVTNISDLIIGQPEFFTALDQLVKSRPLDDWKVYLHWHVLHSAANYLSEPFETESFHFYGTVLSGQPAQEPRWELSSRRIDRCIGEASGELFVDKYYPPEAGARMDVLIEDLKSVLHDRLEKLPWMTEPTKKKALLKFAALTKKIGHPVKFRDYSSIDIRRDDYLGNVQRSDLFESKRELARVGKPVDKTEWDMTPQTVNAYFNPPRNEIVFPAGILQPPFFDVEMDDAVNYGAIGAVIGHEMTHSYDDEGRKFDENGNLTDWWTEADAKAFEERAQKLVDQYSGYEALPGLFVKGKLTLGENIADLGGVTIAYEALQRDLARDPSKRKKIDGLTPEQRFFISFAQIWRVNWREAALRQAITVDPHSPGQFRAIGPCVNVESFFDAFNIKEGAPLWRAPEKRAIIW